MTPISPLLSLLMLSQFNSQSLNLFTSNICNKFVTFCFVATAIILLLIFLFISFYLSFILSIIFPFFFVYFCLFFQYFVFNFFIFLFSFCFPLDMGLIRLISVIWTKITENPAILDFFSVFDNR